MAHQAGHPPEVIIKRHGKILQASSGLWRGMGRERLDEQLSDNGVVVKFKIRGRLDAMLGVELIE